MLYIFLIPAIVFGIGYLLFNHRIVWWEVLLGFLSATLFIAISYFSMKKITLEDTEYNGYMITEARYYEPWETYIHKTCYYTVSCGKNCTRTVAYDCSYCKRNNAEYELMDSGGYAYHISEEEYEKYVKLWNYKKPEFVELNRDITFYGSCGKDGDLYRVNWNGNLNRSVASTVLIFYENVLQTNHSAFNYPEISKEAANKLQLYDYPQIDNYFQNTVLGLENLSFDNANYLKKKINYFNGMFGEKFSGRVFIMVFKDKDSDVAYQQEAYWNGGNRNEINICIGTDKIGTIKWVKAFSWVKEKRVLVDLREELIEAKSLNNVDLIYQIIYKNISKNFRWRNFTKDFSYLYFEPTKSQVIFICIGTLVVSLLILIWGIKNDINPLISRN